jgi:hypothetical protein
MPTDLALEVPDDEVPDEVVNCVAHYFPGTKIKQVVLDEVDFEAVELLKH